VKNKVFFVLAILVIVGIALSGCSTNSSAPVVTETIYEDTFTEDDSAYLPEEDFLTQIEINSSYLYNLYEDSVLLEMGYATCDAFDDGLSASQVVSTILDVGLTPTDGAVLLYATVYSLCPIYYDDVMEWSNGLSQ
jgi:hypothetical protein